MRTSPAFLELLGVSTSLGMRHDFFYSPDDEESIKIYCVFNGYCAYV